MTPREPEPSDFDRSVSSARRDHDDRDRDDWPGHDAGDGPTTGHHRIPDELRDYDGLSRTGRTDGTPPAPRRRRGTPPTHGLPVPPPPITKEFVSEDAPRPIGDLPSGDLTDSRPVSSAGAGPVPGPRHSDPDDETDRPAETGRHGAATSSHRAPDRPTERPGRFAGFRVPRSSDANASRAPGDPSQPARDGRHDRRSQAEAPSAGRGGAADTPPSRNSDTEISSTGESGAPPDLRSFGGLRAGVARLGGARVGDALRQRGASPTSGGPRRRFGGTGEQPTIEPNGRGDGATSASGDDSAGRARTRRGETGPGPARLRRSAWLPTGRTHCGATDRGSGVRCPRHSGASGYRPSRRAPFDLRRPSRF